MRYLRGFKLDLLQIDLLQIDRTKLVEKRPNYVEWQENCERVEGYHL